MFGQLGFIGRLLLVVFGLLLGFLSLVVTLALLARENRSQGAERFPVPAQAAAIVELLDRTPEHDRPQVLKAVSSDRFAVTVAPDAAADAGLASRMPAAEWLVRQYLETLPQRTIRVHFGLRHPSSLAERLINRLMQFNNAPVSIQVSLRDGSFANFQLRSDGSRRLFGIPFGFWLGAVGCLFAAFAMWAIVREARPLASLAQSVERFSRDGTPRPVDPQGAPELRRLIGSNNEMQARIAALLKGRTMLLGAISHDLKTYVTRLRLRAEYIEPYDQQDRAVRDLDDMTALIDSALTVARGTAAPNQREIVDINELVTAEVHKRGNDAISLAPTPQCQSQVVAGDAVALRSVVSNLLDNAVRYAGHCHVAVNKTGQDVEITVEDDGPGIGEEEREMIFEPFYRIDKSRSTTTGGSGLGLAIAKQIVEAHGGTISVGASSLGGASFRVSLPIAQAE